MPAAAARLTATAPGSTAVLRRRDLAEGVEPPDVARLDADEDELRGVADPVLDEKRLDAGPPAEAEA